MAKQPNDPKQIKAQRELEKKLRRDMQEAEASWRRKQELLESRKETFLSKQFIDRAEQYHHSLDVNQSNTIEWFKNYLKLAEGRSFQEFEDNHRFVMRINALMVRFGVQPICPKCGNLAILRCRKPGKSKSGVFQFEHHIIDPTGKTHGTNHGGTSTFPAFKLTRILRPQD